VAADRGQGRRRSCSGAGTKNRIRPGSTSWCAVSIDGLVASPLRHHQRRRRTINDTDQRGVSVAVWPGLAILAASACTSRGTEASSLDVRLFANPRLSSPRTLGDQPGGLPSSLWPRVFLMSLYMQKNVRGYSTLHAGVAHNSGRDRAAIGCGLAERTDVGRFECESSDARWPGYGHGALSVPLSEPENADGSHLS